MHALTTAAVPAGIEVCFVVHRGRAGGRGLRAGACAGGRGRATGLVRSRIAPDATAPAVPPRLAGATTTRQGECLFPGDPAGWREPGARLPAVSEVPSTGSRAARWMVALDP